MYWYAITAFTAYAALLIWQVTVFVEIGGRWWLAIPILVVKLLFLVVALAYWDPAFCLPLNNEVGVLLLLVGASAMFGEAAAILKPAFLEPDPKYDNLVLAVCLLGAVILPAGALFFAGSVVLGHRCAI
jgi:hypothetical protein